jgi:formylglycine-generating enzyme required for sulfatase activity
MDISNLCMGCMSEKGETKVCPHCGRQDETQSVSPLFLPAKTILSGRYLVGRVLGYGGFGVTYLAFDLKLRIKLAVKEYFPQNLATRTPGDTILSVFTGEAREYYTYGLDKFLEEARSLARFNGHPCIVSVYDFFEENGTAYLVMDYVEGITLKEYLDRKGGKISFETTLEIIMPVMDTLREIHRTGMLHRDISPDNIYITVSRHVKLLDFGSARQALGEHSKSLSVILKPGYSPEEQYRSKGKQGPWTDVYAVAATIYRMITGEIPPEALDRLEEDALQPPLRMGAVTPVPAEKTLLNALAVRAKDRFQTMEEFQEALSEHMDKFHTNKEVVLKRAEGLNSIIPPKETAPVLREIVTPPEIMIKVEGGTFMMGDTFGEGHEDERPVHKVTLDYDFYLGAYEVTFDEFDLYCSAVRANKPSDQGWGRGKRPVINISWWEAIKYCNWLSQQEGFPKAYNENTGELLDSKGQITVDIIQVKGYRLPTEAEWEYAASGGGKKIRFGNGRDIARPSEINFDASTKYDYSEKGEYRKTTMPVGSFVPNSLGLYDMSGNVWEWGTDWYKLYISEPETNPYIYLKGSARVLRGGSWFRHAGCVRVACRSCFASGSRDDNVGFRLLRTS